MGHNYTLTSEASIQSQNSPGIIKNSESLLRIIYGPENYIDGVIQPSALSMSDLLERGVSVDRLIYSKKGNIESLSQRQMAKATDKREKLLIVKFSCNEARKIIDDEIGEQSFIVIDNSVEENIEQNIEENLAHACIYSNPQHKRGRAKVYRVMFLLFLNSQQPNVLSLNEVF